MMSHRLACELSDKIAAIGPVAGALDAESCVPSQPVSAIVFHGTADEHVLYEGGRPQRQLDPHPHSDRSVAESVSFWVKQDGCRPNPKRREQETILRELYSGGRNGAEVELVTIRGGGHAWPGGQKWASGAEEPTKEISATEVMWEFFAAHPKR